MIKRKIASDAPHVRRVKEIMLNRINQINIYPEFLRPSAIETQIDEFRRVINELDPNEWGHKELKSKYYSEWSDAEIADYRDNFLAGVAIPKLEAMMGGEPDDEMSPDSIVREILDLVGNKPGFKDSLDLMIESLKHNGADDAKGYARMLLLAVSRRYRMRADAFGLLLDLFKAVGGEEAERILNDFIMDMEAELNDENRSFLFKLSSKSFNGLISLANSLDARGYSKEANKLDLIIRKLAK